MSALESIDMQELEQELQQTRGMFKNWADVTAKAAQDSRATHTARLKTAKEHVEALQRSCPGANARDSTGPGGSDIQALAPHIEQQQLQQQLAAMQKELQDTLTEHQLEQQDLAAKQEDQHHTLRSLRKLLSAYEHCLGLQMEPGEDHLKIIFTQISEAMPEEPYMFAVQVQEDTTYTVVECNPEVPGWQELAQQLLGEQQDLAGFMGAMRRRFKELATATDGVAAMSLQQRQQRRRS